MRIIHLRVDEAAPKPRPQAWYGIDALTVAYWASSLASWVFLPGGWRKEGSGQLCENELANPGALEASTRRDRCAVDRRLSSW